MADVEKELSDGLGRTEGRVGIASFARKPNLDIA